MKKLNYKFWIIIILIVILIIIYSLVFFRTKKFQNNNTFIENKIWKCDEMLLFGNDKFISSEKKDIVLNFENDKLKLCDNSSCDILNLTKNNTNYQILKEGSKLNIYGTMQYSEETNQLLILKEENDYKEYYYFIEAEK